MVASNTLSTPLSSPFSGSARFTAARAAASVLAPMRTGTSVVRLIDRRTGLTHRVNGTPLMVFTHTPEATAAELLSGRDKTIWEARVETIQPSA